MSRLDKKPIGSVSRTPGAVCVYGSPLPLPDPNSKLGETSSRWRCTQTCSLCHCFPKAEFIDGNYKLETQVHSSAWVKLFLTPLHPQYLILVFPMHSDHSNRPDPSNSTNADDKTTPYGTLQTLSKSSSNWTEQKWVWILLGQMMIIMVLIAGVWW